MLCVFMCVCVCVCVCVYVYIYVHWHVCVCVCVCVYLQVHACVYINILCKQQEHFGYLQGLKVAWVGDGNNILHSLMMGCTKLGIDLSFATPQVGLHFSLSCSLHCLSVCPMSVLQEYPVVLHLVRLIQSDASTRELKGESLRLSVICHDCFTAQWQS